jgi:hypothetical protein
MPLLAQEADRVTLIYTFLISVYILFTKRERRQAPLHHGCPELRQFAVWWIDESQQMLLMLNDAGN